MRWNKTLRTPTHGDVQIDTVFAFFPTTMSDGKTVVWLERYCERVKYSGTCNGWITTEKFISD